MSKRDATVAIEGKVPKQPQRRTQRERSETTKKRILQAAATVLREHGYAGFRTEVVAQEAGLSRGAMLHHFPRKNDLLIATHKELYKRALEESLRVMKKNAKANDLDAMIADGEAFFLGGHFFSVLDVVLSAFTDPDLRDEILNISRNARLPIEQAWRERLSASVPQALADDIVFMTLNMIRGYAMRTLWDEDSERYKRMVSMWKQMIELLCAQYGANTGVSMRQLTGVNARRNIG